MGIYSIPVYFQQAPTPAEVVTALEGMTGLQFGKHALEQNGVSLTHPAEPSHPLWLAWCNDRQQWHRQLEARLERPCPLPFPTYPVSITIEAELINTHAQRYLRNTTLAVLHRLGGVQERPFELPAWANYPWQQVPPRNLWQKIKSQYIKEF